MQFQDIPNTSGKRRRRTKSRTCIDCGGPTCRSASVRCSNCYHALQERGSYKPRPEIEYGIALKAGDVAFCRSLERAFDDPSATETRASASAKYDIPSEPYARRSYSPEVHPYSLTSSSCGWMAEEA